MDRMVRETQEYRLPKSKVESEMKRGRSESDILAEFMDKSEKKAEDQARILRENFREKTAKVDKSYTRIREDSKNYIVGVAVLRKAVSR